MIEGFYAKTGTGKSINHVTFLTNTKYGDHLKKSFKTTPKLITNHITPNNPKYVVSDSILPKNPNNYEIPLKYVAVLDTVYHIHNSEILWKKICNSGLFDIWKYESPLNSLRFLNSTKDRPDSQILLLRVYEIDKMIEKDNIEFARRYYKVYPRKVKLERPILNNTDFKSIKNKLYDTLLENNSLRKSPENCFDTCLIRF
jgi:hypothetical protein